MGQVSVPDEGFSGHGRDLSVRVNEARATHVSVGDAPLRLPQPSQPELGVFLADPTVATALARWGVALAEGEAPSSSASRDYAHGGSCAGFVPPCGGTLVTSCCLQHADGNNDRRQLVVCGNQSSPARAGRICDGPFAATSCGTAGPAGCSVCWVENIQAIPWATSYATVVDTCSWWRDVSYATYDNVSLSYAFSFPPTDIAFSRDGLKHFVVTRDSGGNGIYEYALSNAWDVSSAGAQSFAYSTAALEPNPQAVFFTPDGLTMFVLGTTNKRVYQFNLASPWDTSTASYASRSFYVGTQSSNPTDLAFNDAGTRMFVLENTGRRIYQYSLSTAWNVNFATYGGISLSLAGQDASPTGMEFRGDGKKLLVLGDSNDAIFQYSLPTAWTLQLASYDNVSLSVASENTAPQDLVLGNAGAKVYILGTSPQATHQYSQ